MCFWGSGSCVPLVSAQEGALNRDPHLSVSSVERAGTHEDTQRHLYNPLIVKGVGVLGQCFVNVIHYNELRFLGPVRLMEERGWEAPS